jgi:hypothetical protein
MSAPGAFENSDSDSEAGGIRYPGLPGALQRTDLNDGQEIDHDDRSETDPDQQTDPEDSLPSDSGSSQQSNSDISLNPEDGLFEPEDKMSDAMQNQGDRLPETNSTDLPKIDLLTSPSD